MASGPITGGGVPKTKHKWSDSGNKSQKRSRPTTVRPVPLVSPSNSLGSEENHQMMKISLSSISKLEVRNLKRKLMAELEEVRSLIKRFEPQGNFAGGFGSAELPPLSNKKVKTAANGGKKGVHGAAAASDKGTVQILKSCNNLLTKLMKHKSGWVFNTPVDTVRLGLHDYHNIIKKPMDLGTVKTRLSKSWYKSPLEFAEDVRLTFNNAMLYNPVGHDVHSMAGILLNLFEEKWGPLEKQYELLNRRQTPVRDIDFHAPVSTNTHSVERLPLRPPSRSSSPPTKIVENRTVERAESMTNPVEPAVLTVVPEKRPEEEEASGNRDLTFEEKRSLSEDLQELPYDKLEAVVQIIKKSNPELAQQDDEIELDIDSLDLETLWELYRFVTEYKKSLSKKKEELALGSVRDAESVHNSVQEPSTLTTGLKSPKGHVASPVRQEVNAGGSSSSNSSSSGSGSCSSDSDSDSSGHGSDNGN
ncbi:PREDICTED: transcription factor GTE3, chloroplastic-like [Camelina sativa]|uniref:Transcription factor GTE3, chloroplastic-like n=1 Tax=Camelina sativa TaxID=90675 RepID=A0ABM0STZ3_CAMSA|nr:PREDICTED: transcription factor GTE3, chloroplastic-like [Camelina sativa]